MKKTTTKMAILLAVIALIAAACSSGDDAGTADGDFRVAIVGPSASNDLAVTQSIVESVDKLEADGLVS
ncbi:MAG: hypothetical protein ABFR53_05485, partial [Actinomycetota bacterium]